MGEVATFSWICTEAVSPPRRVGGPGLQVVVGPVPAPGGSWGVLLCLLLATLAPPATANPTDSWADLPDAIAGRRESATDAPQPSAARPTLAGGVTPVVLTLNFEASTESWMTPEGLPYEDHLEFDTRVTGTVTLSPGRAEGDQWVCTEGHYELNTHLLGTATRENWLWHETIIHNFDSLGEFYSAPGPPAPCDARLALRDGQVDEFFLSLPSSPANENAHVYALRYSRAKAQAEVWIRLPPPFRYRDEYQAWEIPGTITAANIEGSFTGSVVDSRGQPVAGAQVSFAGTPLTADAVGQFRVNRVAPGPLRITVTKQGFEPYDRTASMPAFLAVTHTIVLKEQQPVGSPW
ncbi:MAG: carboxypeptidase-like regulatory domain-containing protein [Verrucomicrobia bacterium]|nr:carboxypeptidase-like regulatory domain-containing protein [Verrucomicrobiota bacterium]